MILMMMMYQDHFETRVVSTLLHYNLSFVNSNDSSDDSNYNIDDSDDIDSNDNDNNDNLTTMIP